MADLKRNFAEISPPLPNCVPTYFLSLNLILAPALTFLIYLFVFREIKCPFFGPKILNQSVAMVLRYETFPRIQEAVSSHISRLPWLGYYHSEDPVSRHNILFTFLRGDVFRALSAFLFPPPRKLSAGCFGSLWAPAGFFTHTCDPTNSIEARAENQKIELFCYFGLL